MSRRPEAGGSPRSGKRSLVSYLLDRRIGIKLGFILFVPTLATVIVGVNGLVSQISTANTADRARVLATLSGDAGALVQELQNERADAAMLLGQSGSGPGATAAKKAFEEQISTTDTARRDYSRQSSSQGGLPGNFKSLLANIQTQLSTLPKLRQDIEDPDTVMPLSLAVKQYDVLITGLLGIRDSSVQLAGDSSLSYEMRAAAGVSNAKEYLSQERVVVLEALLNGTMPPEQRQQFIATQTGQAQALNAFNVVATNDQQELLHRLVSGPDLRPSVQDEYEILSLPSDKMPADLSPADWDKAMVQRASQMRAVEQQLDNQTVNDAQTLRDNVQRQIIIDVGLLFGMVLIAMLIAWGVARSMNRSLRELKNGALTVARYGLPQAVQRLRDPALATQLSPGEVALQIAEPLPVRSRDEFGEVTEAFNAVHLEAVRTAAEQAALRSSVATMFVNLARRSQILVDRLIGHLDRLERGEEDPDRLGELFQLDHLATRMRRNDENLLVLAGADSTRVQREPAALIDVLRAAQSEVEHYTRIEFGMIDRDLEVASHAVNDLVHLVAELFDNATAFSPPEAAVLVEARRVGDRAVLYVEDHGIGISSEQLADLNDRLATPPMVDVAVSRMMGLVVVARLATRHGIKVELRPAGDRGTVADVMLPTTVLLPRSLGGRPTTGVLPPGSNTLQASSGGLPPAEPTRAPLAAPQQPRQMSTRTPFGPPLELESGSSWGNPRSERRTPPYQDGDRTPYENGPRTGSPRVGAPGGFAAAAETFGDHDLFGNNKRNALPSWSDLTGADQEGVINPSDASPLPQRRINGDEPQADDRRIPRQRPHKSPLDESSLMDEFAEAELIDDPYGRRPVDDDMSDVIDAAVDERPPPASMPPPAWPPVQAPSLSGGDGGFADPSGNGSHRSLDMTAEIPAVRELDLAGALRNDRAGQQAPAPSEPISTGHPSLRLTGEPGQVLPFADETMELPIFRELESAWFRSADPSEPFIGLVSERRDEVGESGVRLPVGGGAPRASASAMGGTSMSGTGGAGGHPDTGWSSPGDEGWRAAAQLADADNETSLTDGGLPKRVPMAQLVPGGVEKSTTSTNRRSPESVRGLLSAYHRGVQRGRAQTGDESNASSESTTTGHSSPGGKEQQG